MSQQQNLPVVPIKNTVLFPNLLMPLSVGRPKSVAAIQAAVATEAKEILVLFLKDLLNFYREALEPFSHPSKYHRKMCLSP